MGERLVYFDHLRDDDTVGQGLLVEFGKEQRKDLL